ncbi:MAG: condensation domain-containing protein, partial [Pseudomonas sp.]
MNAEDALKLARRYIDLPLEKRRLFLQALQREGVDFAQLPIPSREVALQEQVISYAQQRMWLLWQLDPQSAAYNLPSAVRLCGTLNLQALEQAFADLMQRHATLRTAFTRLDDGSVEPVAITALVQVEQQDFTHLDPQAQEEQMHAAARQQMLQPFDLESGPLLRVAVLRLQAHEHVLLLTLHHIVSDGWSMNVLIDEFTHCYQARNRHSAPQLPALALQYSDYALWQRRWLEAGEQERQLAYWRAQLGDDHPPLELPLDHPRPALPGYAGTRHELVLEHNLAEQLRALARKQNVTLFMLLLGAFSVLLQRYSGQSDVRVGVPIANRNRREVEGLIGFFVNTQVLRTRLDPQMSVSALLAQIKDSALGAQAHQELPFEQLVDALKLERTPGQNPLFQVMYNHQPQVADISVLKVGDDLQLEVIEPRSRTTQFDLTLDTYEKGGSLHAALTFANELFELATIERMGQHWLGLLRAMLADPQQSIGNLPLLDGQERDQIVRQWNDTHVDYALDWPVHAR